MLSINSPTDPIGPNDPNGPNGPNCPNVPNGPNLIFCHIKRVHRRSLLEKDFGCGAMDKLNRKNTLFN